MQEINLLQNKVKDRTLQFERSNRLVMVLFVLVVILEIAGTAGLYLLIHTTKAKTTEVIQQNADTQTNMNKNQKDLVLAQGLQAQLKNVHNLLSNHIYWSAFLNEVSSITPTKVRFVSITGSVTDDKLHVEAMAQSYQDIGRLLLALGTSDQFKDVKLHSVTPGQGAEFGYSFSMEMTVLPSIFKKK
jgi:Tfp pilus assembly protein PilN